MCGHVEEGGVASSSLTTTTTRHGRCHATTMYARRRSCGVLLSEGEPPGARRGTLFLTPLRHVVVVSR